MANARLKIARQAGKRRRRGDAQSIDEALLEVPSETSAEKDQESPTNEQFASAHDVRDVLHEAFREKKLALEERLHELTMGKPLHKMQEPGYDVNGYRLKRAHHDFLLQEMEWMAADFAQERKWRMKSARTLSVSLVSYHSKQATKVARLQKAEDEAKRRLAARIGRDVKKFWTKIDKIISYKVKLQADELRKAAMDKHLKQLVSQTERYASALAMAFQDALGAEGPESADDSVDVKTDRPGCSDDSEEKYILDTDSLVDGRAASAVGSHAETNRTRDRDTREACNLDDEKSRRASTDYVARPKESIDSAADLSNVVADGSETSGGVGSIRASSVGEDEEASGADKGRKLDDASDSDFAMNSGEEEDDDEETIAIDEQMTTREEVDEEVALLEEEGELSIEELRARYARAFEEEASDGEESEHEGPERVVLSEKADVAMSGSEDEDFRPSNAEESDDESTIAAAEANDFTTDEVNEEMRLLKEEGELSIDELRTRYAAVSSESELSDQELSADGDQAMSCGEDVDEEYTPTDEESDDETTIDMVEANGISKKEVNEEVSLLHEESELSIEELRARYARALQDESEDGSEDDAAMSNENQAEVGGVKAAKVHETKESIERDESKLVQTIQCRNSLSSRHGRFAGFKRPYLLTSRLSLREYQEAGVNWLISMCEKRINGILADEMGLGKTIQTISLLAHLACNQGIWGPHLIVVPTSCLVNWEMEFKRWCPAFKVLTYYGSAKRRKELRQGWSKQNAFQICITSYQLVVQDAHCFKRKKWYYLILDEAHNIKNWKSLRWQTLLNFNSQRRLLLTGTPLQNNIMELWSLMHFLMPHVFSSRREFTYWFQHPLSLMVEGEQDVNNQLVGQLHGIIRPFVLRRLKKDVAKQMPGKFEHVVTCKLSKRQRFLYEDFISRSSTRRAMFGHGRGNSGGNFMSMMNVLMQLRKVCNHPDLFEPRPIASPFDMPAIRLHVPSRCGYLVDDLVNEGRDIPFWNQNRNLPNLEIAGCEKYISSRWRHLYYYDINAPLPPDTNVSDETRERFADKKDILKRLVQNAALRASYWQEKRAQVAEQSRLRVQLGEDPMYGSDLIRVCTLPVFISHAMDVHAKRKSTHARDWLHLSDAMSTMVKDSEDRIREFSPIVSRAVCFVPKARAQPLQVIYDGGGFASASAVARNEFVLSRKKKLEVIEQELVQPVASKCLSVYYEAFKRTQLFFPDKRLLQYDCGKLQQLDTLLRELKRGNHRCLIFTQMSSMLNILEIFLNIHGHTYFRLDGSTKVEKRQSLMDRFNRDEKIFCFILSTRSGGLGINLTGADSVIFYDSDWNPAMDAQAQDRAHRIGQTRDVHIYRLVSEHTVEENILKKAQQKRHLDFLVMAEGQFTTDFFSKANLRELVTGEEAADTASVGEIVEDEEEPEMSYEALENAMAQIEDEEDVVAMKGAKEEFISEKREFEEEITHSTPAASRSNGTKTPSGIKPSTPSSLSVGSSVSEKDDDNDDMESVDGSFAVSEGRDDDEEHDEINDQNNDEELVEEESDGSDSDELSSDSDADSLDDEDATVSASRNRKRPVSRAGKSRNVKHRRGNEGKSTHVQSERADERAKEKAREKLIEMEEERKLQAWKDSVSSLKGFEDSLNPVDRYALHFREEIDPLYSYVPTAAAVENFFESQNGKLDIDKIEEDKMLEESNLIAEGELIAGIMCDGEDQAPDLDNLPDLEERHRALYKKERAHVHFVRRQRQLTGVAWKVKKCVNTNHPFYYNVDTREATWDRPVVWTRNEQFELSRQLGYSGLVPSALQLVMKCLCPYPDRQQAQLVCKSWREAANHPGLFVKLNVNDLYPDGATTLSEILAKISIGDTVVFGSGVYHLDDLVEIRRPIKLLASPDSHVELQMTKGKAQLKWTAKGGMLCGFHITRQTHTDEKERDDSPSNWQHLLHVANGGQVRVQYCDFDGSNQGNACVAVSGSNSSRAILLNNRIYYGGSSGVLLLKGNLFMNLNSVYGSVHSGISILGGNAVLRRNKIQMNGRFGIRLLYHAGNVIIENNIVNDHPCGNIDTENSGRRFVIRWNDMSKEEPDDLPHSHGQLLLKTSHIVEKEIKVPPKKVPTPKITKAPASSQANAPPVIPAEFAGSVPLTPSLIESVAVTSSVAALMNPPGMAVIITPTKAEMPPGVSSQAMMVDKSELPESGTTKEMPGKPEVSVAANSIALSSTQTPDTIMSEANEKPTMSENGEQSTTTKEHVHVALEPARLSPVLSVSDDKATHFVAGENTVSVKTQELVPLPNPVAPIKLKRKRKPKIEKLLVDGRIIVFSDTCDKRSDKVKKPRLMKPSAGDLKEEDGPHASTVNDALPSAANVVASTTENTTNEQIENSCVDQIENTEENVTAMKPSADLLAQASSHEEDRGVLQPVMNQMSESRPHLASIVAKLQQVGLAVPISPAVSASTVVPVVVKKRGRKPKTKLLEHQESR